MFNRSTKLTALLVAAASIASSVPAMAATKLANKEGTVENAVAFKDGKYLYQGYRTDDDEKALYYNAGDSDKKLDDADTLGYSEAGRTSFKYDDKYVAAEDSGDEYIVDLSTGKITDDDTVGDSLSTAETKLKTKLNKTDRYNKDNTGINTPTLTKVGSNRTFEDVWYSYTATTTGGGQLTGYTNGSGTYIDCSKNVNMYVFNGTKMVKVEDLDDAKDGITVSNLNVLGTIGQDDKYLYRVVTVDVVADSTTSVKAVKPVDADGNAVSTDPTTLTYIQRISKAQGDKEKDAYLPKTTDSYQIDVNTGNGDVKDAYNLLVDSNGALKTGVQTKVVDGALYVIYQDDDKVKVNKIVFKTSEKLDIWNSTATAKTGDKVDGHVAKKDGDTDTKADDFCFDINGNVWAIYKGEIKKSSKKSDFETVYTCDRSLNQLDVYDENNLVAWDADGDVYTTVQEGSDAAKKEATEIIGEQPAPVAKTGWQKDATTGTWTLYDAVGTQLTGWQLVGGKYYYMDPSTGVMQTGWVKSPASGKWYYMDPVNGDMKTGWQLVGGKWYYMNPSNGDMQTGWVYDGSNWYYMYSDGSMASNTTIDGYVLNASGAWIN